MTPLTVHRRFARRTRKGWALLISSSGTRKREVQQEEPPVSSRAEPHTADEVSSVGAATGSRAGRLAWRPSPEERPRRRRATQGPRKVPAQRSSAPTVLQPEMAVLSAGRGRVHVS